MHSSPEQELALLSTTSYIATVFALASGHPGLEIKTWTTVLHAVLYHEIHKRTTTCRGHMCVTMCARTVNLLMWLDLRTHVHIFESLQLQGLYVGDLLYSILIILSYVLISQLMHLPLSHSVYHIQLIKISSSEVGTSLSLYIMPLPLSI